MKVEVQKRKITKNVIKSISEIDKEFYTRFNYDDLSWYYERYNTKNDIFLLLADNKIVGYFLFIEISKSLFDDICQLKYDNDYDFPVKDLNCKSGYFYMPSVIVKKDYRFLSVSLIRALYKEVKNKDKLVVITVSKNGHRMASKVLTFLGIANKKKDIRSILWYN